MLHGLALIDVPKDRGSFVFRVRQSKLTTKVHYHRPKRQKLFTNSDGVSSQKTLIFNNTAVKTHKHTHAHTNILYASYTMDA